ncbi:MAG: hypothetical protein PSX81_13550 [bacterium]|nr:hypothetical protein [bacterium]
MCGLLAYFQKQPFDRTTINDIYQSLQLINHRSPDAEGAMLNEITNLLMKEVG